MPCRDALCSCTGDCRIRWTSIGRTRPRPSAKGWTEYQAQLKAALERWVPLKHSDPDYVDVAATAILHRYMEINAQNIDSFHFHGDMHTYPLSVVIAVPNDDWMVSMFNG
jgi:hypothetical protein